MALYVNTNVSSINAQRKLTNATKFAERQLPALSLRLSHQFR